MADALGLDPTYLSQLENGRRDVDDWYLQKAEELVQDFEKAKEIKDVAPEVLKEEHAPNDLEDLRAKCHLHLNKVLDECRGDREQLAWTFVELTKRFPLRESAQPGQFIASLRRGIRFNF